MKGYDNLSVRLDKLRLAMKESGFDAVWVSSRENHLYLSGFDNPDGSLLITEDCAFAFEDFRYIEAAKRQISAEDFQVIMPTGKRRSWLPELLEADMVSLLAFEDAHMTCRDRDALESDCRGICSLAPSGELFSGLRIIKDENEVALIRKAQRIAEISFEQLLPEINVNCTETYLAALLEFLMKKNGSEGISFDTIAVSGKASSSPHGVPRDVKLEKGFLTFDFGAVCGGYRSDMTRTVCIGKPTPEMKKVYDTVLQAQTAVLEVIGDSASCYKMDSIARNIIDRAGYPGTFGHSLGHGVGLYIHELPNLSPSSGDRRLDPGNIVTVEPGIYIQGKYGCRIEDMVHITPGGAENLTAFSKDLIIL